MPLVSVVTPVYNGEKYLAQAIESILGQTFTDFEFIIVDDGSTDGSAEIVRGYQARDGRISLVSLKDNVGIAAARNAGLAAAGGGLVAMADCDDVCLARRLERQVDYLRSHPDVGLLGASVTAVDPDLNPVGSRDVPLRHVEIVAGLFFRGPSLLQPTVIARRSALLAIGGYDASLRVADDTDLFMRLAPTTRFANLDARLCLYRRHGENDTVAKRQRYIERGRELRNRWLRQLWGAAPGASAERLDRLRDGDKFSPLERRRLAQDLKRLVDAMIATGAVDEADRQHLQADMRRRLEGTLPRNWLRLLHWYRHRIKRHLV